MMKKSLRLLITKQCNRHCAGCCNKDWDLDNLPVVTSFKGYDKIILTGGEPLLLEYEELKSIILNIKKSCSINTKIYLYTAMLTNRCKFNMVLSLIDGITLTLHTPKDIYSFYMLNYNLDDFVFNNFSMRLNIFKEVKPIIPYYLERWKVQKNMVWIKNCPLPKNEVFMKYQ